MVEQPERPPGTRITTSTRILTRPEQVSMPISLEEWDGLVNRVESCQTTIQPWSLGYSVAFGVGVTAGLSIAPIAFSQLPWWVLTIYIVFCALGLSLGIILVIAERALAHRQQSEIGQLVSDMKRIKASFISAPS